jgi:hypothetical protein
MGISFGATERRGSPLCAAVVDGFALASFGQPERS